MFLREISQAEFNALPASEKIFCYEAEFSHKFAYLSVKEEVKPILLCWRSELVEPQIIDSENSSLLWFGIDEQLLAVNKANGKIVLHLLLQSTLLELLTAENSVFVRTELEIYSFSLDGVLQTLFHLPEISESIRIENNTLKIDLIDGRSLIEPL